MDKNKQDRRLGKLLTQVGEWNWEEFGLAERDESYSTSDAIIFSLIRSCAMENIGAIKLAINRVDGKLVTPIQIVYPKLFFQFPNATAIAEAPQQPKLEAQPQEGVEVEDSLVEEIIEASESVEVMVVEPLEGEEQPESDLPTLGFRQTMDRMIDYPRSLPKQIVDRAQAFDAYLSGAGPKPEGKAPSVKSVVAAHLLQMASKRDIDALYEVFDSIDGKLTETLKVVGEDIYITQFSSIAPYGAEKNEEGIYEIEATRAQEMWRSKLGGDN